ncbi:sensor histidine kinase [Winogradskyella haliclonae]|uniref:Histidine kinase n=1 Tax=Winogradskyella haliclonae TaxID=2048558 RepID=A0ABQ2BYK6_9FLAO|nr:sensor histidine kinase [Winogradskyella haliclonae]GGI57314.1 histidine kinase [Winogradskyella haliclonae]
MQSLNIKTILQRGNYHRPLIFNGVLWFLAFLILLFIFSKGKTPITADYIYTVVFLVTVAIPVSINFYVLIPKFLTQERYAIYSILFILNFCLFSFLNTQLFNAILDALFPKYFFVSYLSEANVYLTYGIILIATTLFKLAEDWFYYNTNENRVLKLQNQQIQTQLSALRAQINPHFLFNSLNVIYAMALEKKEDIKTAIIELSDILRYVIYDSDTERVTLKDELELLKNYISFQKYRGHSENTVDLVVEIEDENYNIYPMLLLPLLENAYKYGFSGDNTADKIQIEFIQNASDFKFRIENTNANVKNSIDENYSGVGLQNLRNNLNLVYPDTHNLNIEHTDVTFVVTLNLKNE